jgi:glycosyltransferase involved in cell wall biosynthesis
MKIAWFTPFSKKSAIARFSQGVVAELARVAEVDLCHFDSSEIREAIGSVRRFPSASAIDDQTLSRYDLVIYNLGNYLPYHREIYLTSRRWPGICILHDFVMHHFFAAYYLEHLRNPGAYSLLMERLYGEGGGAWLERRLWESDEVVKFPLFEEVIRGALGVITHSEFLKKRVEASFPGPVRRIPLPYDADWSTPVLSRNNLGVDENRILIVTVGHVNPNKRISDVIAALGQLGPIAQRVNYSILGPCSAGYQTQLEMSIQRHRLQGVVHFLGYVTDEILRSYLSHADICINLRYPPMEGASASVIEEMLFGKPVIVNDVGFFSELPDNCVVKIHPERQDELAVVLHRLVADPAARSILGTLAQEFAKQEFRADRYANELMEFAWDVRSARPLLGLADRVALECNRMGITSEMRVVGTVARELQDVFCENRSSPPLWRE